MKFRNASGRHLDFVLHGKRYQLAPHEVCDVPDRIAYAVKAHGLPLERIEEPEAPPASADRPANLATKAMAELQKLREGADAYIQDLLARGAAEAAGEPAPVRAADDDEAALAEEVAAALAAGEAPAADASAAVPPVDDDGNPEIEGEPTDPPPEIPGVPGEPGGDEGGADEPPPSEQDIDVDEPAVDEPAPAPAPAPQAQQQRHGKRRR